METQDDSIDIAKLQRVALGQDPSPSQLDLTELETAGIIFPENLPNIIQENRQTSHDCVSSAAAGQEVLSKSPSNRPGSPSRGPQATSLINANQSTSPPHIRHSRVSVSNPAKMNSADAVPSDTQVVSQSVYDNIIKQNKEGARININNNVGDQGTFMTLHEGDSGHIDLLAGFDHANRDAINLEDNEDQSSDKLGESSPMNFQPNLFPESQRFLTTPATAVKVHSSNVPAETPCASRNPLASNVESSGGIMALSQVFKATQAPSSPLVNGRPSDPLSDRPSPNIPIQSYPLATAMSSPLNSLAATFPQGSSDTQMTYITMKESQARRDKILQERMTRSAEQIYSEDQSDDEFDKEPSFVERIRRQRMVDEEAAAQFAGLTAPARPSRRRQADNVTTSPHKPMRRDWADVPRAPLFEDEPQEPDTALQDGGISEEETEQEDDSVQPVPRSQDPNSLTEEDKENCNDLSAESLAAAASAHGRLSQALALEETLSSSSQESRREHAGFRRHSHTPSRDEQDGCRESSQIMVVKDSQQSPRPKDGDNNDGSVVYGPWNQGQQRHPGLQSETDLENVISSPTKVARMASSPPPSAPQVMFQIHGSQTMARARSNSASSRNSSSQLPRNLLTQEGGRTQSSNPASQSAMKTGDKVSRIGLQDKSSSMPSRVAETPLPQHLRSDVVPSTSVPETSPNRLHNQGWANDTNNDFMDQEDDDLPPIYPPEHGRLSHSQPESSSPLKPFQNAKILSSPSGRQRRALTEIAADASPQAGAGLFDVDIGILTADDKEFSSVVSMSPIPPRKRRRGNGGQSYASDPVLPATPRSTSRFAQFQESETLAAEEPQPEEPVNRSETSFQRRSRPSKRIETVWEVEDSPQPHVSRKQRLKLFSRPRPEQQEPQHQKPEPAQNVEPEKNTVIQPSMTDEPESDTPRPAKNKEIGGQEPTKTTVENDSVKVSLPAVDNVPIALNQVIAPWTGQKRAYYPATCYGQPPSISQGKYLVKFEDSAPIEIPMGAVKRLEFRVGDAVKVDMPNVPKVTHIIRGFGDKLSAEDLSKETANGIFPITDIYGHSTVILGPKQRKSLPNRGLAGPDNIIQVPISRVYLDSILWNQLKDRAFKYSSGTAPSDQTPPGTHSTPTSPATRLSRSIRYLNGVFAGMIFALSYGENDDVKTRITKLILENDGIILKEGFNELFELPSNAPLTTPTKSPAPAVNVNNGEFRLASGATELGFACLIADKHSRRPKYMQALALNIPCLSDRWVEDCVAQNRILDWEIYLLPSGESIYLNGATKSRILAPYSAATARLPETIAARPNLLKGQSVLLVMGRGGRTDEERRKAYIFLTYALGASRVERVPDLKSASVILHQQQAGTEAASAWDWIYVDSDDKASARDMILGASGPGSQKAQSFRGMKRKRTDLMESIRGGDLGLSTNVRIVNNEFVCQSLILGKLFES